uniref:Dynamin-type G domain-containing protein n=1 Tax=Pinguiococcus pyrenoidosus TaxID=172671 RepID=A0A7R9UDJ9_9STRA
MSFSDSKRLSEKERQKRKRTVLKGLQQSYAALQPLEKHTNFRSFFTAPMTDQELAAKPHILVVGQYSTGKTTFINQLVGADYEGCHIGPEPTSDRFIAVCHGDERRLVHGNNASVNPGLPYQGLTTFGQNFLSKFSAAYTPSDVLRDVTFVDTPGVLSGEKQRRMRSYDFAKVTRWFAERADLILLLFDAHKLDISDEFKEVISGLKGLDNKVRCVLNKADQIDAERLVRVYGALMFNIGKILQTPEVVRVFIGSFWDKPVQHDFYRQIFSSDQQLLLKEIGELPRGSFSLKLDELVRRTRLVKVHSCILDKLQRSMPRFGILANGALVQVNLISNLEAVFKDVAREYAKYGISEGDFPEIENYRRHLRELTLRHGPTCFSKLANINEREMLRLQRLLDDVIPLLSRYEVPQNINENFEDPIKALDEALHGRAKNRGLMQAGAVLGTLTRGLMWAVIVASAGGAAYAAVRYSQGKLKLDLESLPYFNKLAAKEK